MNQFHFEVDEGVGLSKLVDLDNVRVIDGREDFSLFPQAFYFGPFDIDFAYDLTVNSNTLTA